MPKLTVMRAEDVVRVIDVASADLRIGRGPDNDVVLPDEGKAVSRFHAELRNEGAGYVVIDLGSQNGTWVNGERVTRGAVSIGEEIAIGPYRLLLSHDGDAPMPTVGRPDPVSTQMAPATILPGAEAAAASTGGTQRLRKTSATVPAAAHSAKSKSSARVVPAGAPAARVGDPIAWLARQPKPMLLGGFLVLVVAITFLRPAPTPATEPVAATVQEADPAPVVPTAAVPPTSPNAETIARHLDEARKLEATQEYERAIREHLEQALLIEPRHSEALEMTARLRDLAAKVTPPVVPPAVPITPVAAVPRPRTTKVEAVDPNLLPRVAGESLPDWQARNATLAADYEAGLERVRAQEWLLAISRFESVAARHPSYRDVELRLGEARASVREAVRVTVDTARGLETKGDLVGALREYQRASSLGHTATDGLAAAVVDRMRREGQDAFTRARQYDALGRVPEAVALYERVVRYLPADDPNRKVAEERLQRLRGGA